MSNDAGHSDYSRHHDDEIAKDNRKSFEPNYTHDHSSDPLVAYEPDLIPSMITTIDQPWREVRDAYFRAVLEHFKGNRTHAAKSLGISVRTLQRWQVEGLKTPTQPH